MRFIGKSVLITGAGAGIGRAAAEAFAREGATTYATDREHIEPMPEYGSEGKIRTAIMDVTAPAQIAAVAAQIGRIDVLVNCAGIVHSGDLLGTDPVDWDRSILVNATSMFHVTRSFLPAMLDGGGGTIINMSSVVSSVKGVPNRCAYAASKAAVIGLTKAIAADYVARGIRCNAICPGTVDTPSLRQRLRETGDEASALQAFTNRQPMGRLASASEIAAMILYLSSDEAQFITGQTFIIDGGMSL